jgi:hypothetical protein
MQATAAKPFDYDGVDWRFLSRLLGENSHRLSRTRSGVSDTSTSTTKRPLLLSGAQLAERVAANEERVHQFIYNSRKDPMPRDGADVLQLLWTLADLTNDGLLPAGKLRTWPIPEVPPESAGANAHAGRTEPVKVAPQDIAAAMTSLGETLHRRWNELHNDVVPLAAWAEWELNGGSLHPFYDGCGRISRSFSALLFVRAGSLPPLYEDSATYFRQGNLGIEGFAAYVRDRIAACAGWVVTMA